MSPRVVRTALAGATVAAIGLPAAFATGCTAWHAQPLPSAVSLTLPGTGRLRAGAARIDITPPPGVGLGGSGPEGRRSIGYRTRLHVGALVLEDASGERIALVVADLPHISASLHRLAAARMVGTTGIGADRLIISATHTHSGPAHFYGERQYNASASRVSGYDPRVADYLVDRIAQAVTNAAASLRPAVLGSGDIEVRGATINRSFAAYCRNVGPPADSICKQHRPEAAVDPRLFMLRVDELETLSGRTRPLASYSVFALHGTVVPTLNTLLDGDAHVRIVKRIARQVDAAAGRPTVHLLANGAEGDVAPVVQRKQCELPKIGLLDPMPMPRGPGEAADFLEPARERTEACIALALVEADQIANLVAGRAIELHRELETRLTRDATVRRTYSAVGLPGHDGLCDRAVIGSSAAAGAPNMETRISGWRWLVPFVPLGLEPGGTAVKRDDGACQSPKRPLLGPVLPPLAIGEHGFPDMVQLTVVRIGAMLLAAVPAEMTTMAGESIRQRVASAAAERGTAAPHTVLVGLANGFLQYVTTAKEYEEQAYEGGSNLFGPGTAEFLAHRLSELARRLPAEGAGPSPIVEVPPMIAYPGPPKSIMASPTAGPAIPLADPIELSCAGGRLVARWLDLAPGRILPRDSAWLALERKTAPQQWERVTTDGDGRLEVYADGARRGSGFRWRAMWRAERADGEFRLVRLDDAGGVARTSNTASCTARAALAGSDLR